MGSDRARWTLQLLGGFRLTDAAGAEIVLQGRLDRTLLAYLALFQKQRHSRPKLAALFWPNRTKALQSLSESLSIVRRALGDKDGAVIAHGTDPVTYDFSAMAVDTLDFERLTAQGTQECLERAEALYVGDLLDGLDGKFDDLERWLISERQRLRDRMVDALVRLAQLRDGSGSPDRAIDALQRALALDELHEPAHRSLIQFCMKAGQRRDALRQAESCEQVLRRNEIVPEPETSRIIEEVRHGGPNGPVKPRPEPAPLTPQPGPQPEPAPIPHDPVKPQPEPEPDPVPVPPHHPPKQRRRLRTLLTAVIALSTASLVISVMALMIIALIWRKNPELLPAWVADVVMEIQGIVLPPLPSIAVLPFDYYGDYADSTVLVERINDGIVGALSNVSEMNVKSTFAVEAATAASSDLRALAKALDVRYLLTGSVQTWGDSVSVQVGLVDMSQDGRQTSVGRYVGDLPNAMALQRDIVLEVVTSLQVSLTRGETERIDLTHSTRNLDAWLAAGRAERLLYKLTHEDNAKARTIYEEVRRMDPAYTGAMEGLAWTYFLEARFGWSSSPAASIARATEIAEQIRAIDPGRPRVYSLLGSINLLTCDLGHAVDQGEKAVEMEPNDADAAALLAYTLTYAGEPRRAINLLDKAMNHSPIYPDWYRWLLGRANRLAGRYNSAIALLETSNRFGGKSLVQAVELAATYAMTGRRGDAGEAADDVLRIHPQFSIAAWTRTPCYADPDDKAAEVAALKLAGLPE